MANAGDCCATGIDLSWADVGVFVELVWEPRDLQQAEGRLHRFGQESPVLIQYVIARGTVDDIILRAVIRKLDNYDKIVGKLDDGLREGVSGEGATAEKETNRKLLDRLAEMLIAQAQ